MVRLGQPVDDHVGPQLRQDEFPEHILGPVDRRLVWFGGPTLGGGRPEALENGLIDLGREGHQPPRIKVPIHQGADATPGLGIEQQGAPSRARTDHGELQCMLLQMLAQGLHQSESPTAHRLEADEMLKLPEVEGTPLVDLRHVHDIAHDAVRARIGARSNRRRIDAGHRGKNGMAIEVVHPFLTQSEERGRINRINRVRTQAVENKHEDHSSLAG